MVAKDLPKVVLYFRNSFSEIQFSYHTARLFKVYIPCLYTQHAELSSITPQKAPYHLALTPILPTSSLRQSLICFLSL